MKKIFAIAAAALVAGCNQVTLTTGDSVTEGELEQFFRTHRAAGNHAVALKKSSLGGAAYLATVHGYPNNLSVCNELISPYNEDSSLSTVPGSYFCEELR